MASNQQVLDDEALRQKKIEEWLPITSSRKGKWWFSAFHNVTAMVGAGVLSLPYAMSGLGWGPGITIFVMSWIITLYTLWQMVEMHEMVPGKRFDRYHELGQHAFGEKLGLYIVVPQQLIVEVGTCIVYMVTGGKSLKKIHESLCSDCKPIRTTYWIMVFASVNFFLSHLPSLDSISCVSFFAALMSLGYSIIIWGASLKRGVQDNVDYSPRGKTTADSVFNFFNSLGDVAFAYAGHNVVLEIQATITSTPERPSKGPMWKGVVVAYIIVAICYFPVAMIGFYVFGNTVDDNILITLEKPTWLISAANFFVIVHVVGGYQIYSMPVFDMIETYLVKEKKFLPSAVLRIVVRTSYVIATMFIGMTFPFFGGLLGFFGGFALAPTSYYLPCIIWLIVYKPKKFSLSWWANWFCIITGIALTIVAPIGALRTIILAVKSYKFYS
ncbi:lysine histidine transporter 1 isoform X1 [Diospyros lotus]|uniref:lysine histidine transporter 1 isoform X1 n=1 Tax=Diospyros lotus TaxID=55363 RepID=UPI002253CB0F|nr:lysine histidine transporter 1 isoform X1 [Diospyros lotus]